MRVVATLLLFVALSATSDRLNAQPTNTLPPAARGPNLADTIWVQSDGGFEGIRETIFWGVRRKDFHDTTRPFEMNPAGGSNLTWDEIRAVSAYVWSLSNGNFLPARR